MAPLWNNSAKGAVVIAVRLAFTSQLESKWFPGVGGNSQKHRSGSSRVQGRRGRRRSKKKREEEEEEWKTAEEGGKGEDEGRIIPADNQLISRFVSSFYLPSSLKRGSGGSFFSDRDPFSLPPLSQPQTVDKCTASCTGGGGGGGRGERG